MFSTLQIFRLVLAFGIVTHAVAASARNDLSDSQKVRVALPQHLIEKSVEAHTHAPLVEAIPDAEPSSLLDNPTLPRFPMFRSRFVHAMVPSEAHRTWRLVVSVDARNLVIASLRKCFSQNEANDEAWPAAVLRAAGNRVQIVPGEDELELRFTSPLGPLPALLAGCMAYGPGPSKTGRFQERGPAQLEAFVSQANGGPTLQRIEFQTQSVGADVFSGEAHHVDKLLHYQSSRNLLFLLSGKNHEGVGLWKLTEPEARSHFVRAMGPQTLLDAFAGGNGDAVERLLPSAWTSRQAPPRHASGLRPAPPLRLSSLGPEALVVRIQVPLEDELAWATAERIAVLMRSVGARGVVFPNNMDNDKDHELALIRWYPESDDDALSLLALAGRHAELSRVEYRALLQDPRFLSPSAAQRREAAHALETAWLQSGVLLPLMVSRSWLAIPPTLKGIHVRSDGVPIFEQAYWWRD